MIKISFGGEFFHLFYVCKTKGRGDKGLSEAAVVFQDPVLGKGRVNFYGGQGCAVKLGSRARAHTDTREVLRSRRITCFWCCTKLSSAERLPYLCGTSALL